MPHVINQVHCKLIGLSCMSAEMENRTLREWDRRFFPGDAFWQELPQGQSTMQTVPCLAAKIAAQGIHALTGVPILAALFLDLTQEPDPARLQSALETPRSVAAALGCNIQAVLAYGYLGTMALTKDRQSLRERVKRLLEQLDQIPYTTQLYLISDSLLGKEGHNWRAAMLWLDVLRRNAAPTNLLPLVPNFNKTTVGFLRYGEFDQARVEELTRQSEYLNRILNDGDDKALRERIERERTEIFARIQRDYPVDGALQPIHPGMEVSGKWAVCQAKRGRNGAFRDAQHKTQEALQDTGRQMRERILKEYRQAYAQPDRVLEQFLREGETGLPLERDAHRIDGILRQNVTTSVTPVLPELSYDANGYARQIGEYLEAVRANAAEAVWEELTKALTQAYKTRTKDYYDNRHTDLTGKKKVIDHQLGGLTKRKELIQLAASGGTLPETDFHPVLGGGGMTRVLLCIDAADARECDQVCANTPTGVYQIDARYGGLKTVDSSPIKALQVLAMDPERHLDDLIK